MQSVYWKITSRRQTIDNSIVTITLSSEMLKNKKQLLFDCYFNLKIHKLILAVSDHYYALQYVLK